MSTLATCAGIALVVKLSERLVFSSGVATVTGDNQVEHVVLTTVALRNYVIKGRTGFFQRHPEIPGKLDTTIEAQVFLLFGQDFPRLCQSQRQTKNADDSATQDSAAFRNAAAVGMWIALP